MPQTYATHRRVDPGYHILLSALLVGNAVISIIHLVHHHAHGEASFNAWLVVMAFALLLMAWKLREYAVRVQDRIIRLEERIRLQALLPGELKARLGELRESQLVALRFASDGEVADRVRETLDEKLGNDAIKKRIQAWRPDEFRV